MKDILWMIYLATTLFLTFIILFNELSVLLMFATNQQTKIENKSGTQRDNIDLLLIALVSIMWAIWYMYFLH